MRSRRRSTRSAGCCAPTAPTCSWSSRIPKTARVHLRLVLDDVGCEECVLPPDMLRETITESLQRRIAGEFELVLDDPRRT